MNAYAQTAGAESFELKKVGDGVWAAVAAARYKVNSNAAVIETNDGLIIVDTHSKPSAAQALYKDIQGVSKKPVKKIINTHFHWDHWQGNQVYAPGQPRLEIIASERTKARLTEPNAGVGGVAFIEKQIGGDAGRDRQAQGRHPEGAGRRGQGPPGVQPGPGRGLSGGAQDHEAGGADAHRVAARRRCRKAAARSSSCRSAAATPTATCSSTCRRRRCVATGDAVVDWMPFLNDGYPEEWAQTVGALEKLDIEQVIVGHGEPAPKSHLTFFRGYLTDLVAAVKKEAAAGAHARRHEEEDRRRAGAEVREGDVEVPARAVPRPHRPQRREVYNKTVKK